MKKYKTIDSHVHCDSIPLIKKGINILSKLGIDKIGAVSYGNMDSVNSNPQVLVAKNLYPDKVYAFGGLNYFYAKDMSEKYFSDELVNQINNLYNIGFDGMKFIETKPNRYRTYPYKLGSNVFDKFFQKAEELKYPLIWHVADPETFWDADKISESARKLGWYYGTGGFPIKEDLYRESLGILDRHKDLRVIFSHFYFLSDDLNRAGKILDKYKDVNFDITPGVEMYYNFFKDSKQTKEFFVKYQDRIIFGTDTLIRDNVFNYKDIAHTIKNIRCFLETEEKFSFNGIFLDNRANSYVKGIKLPEKVLNKIYYKNFERVVGKKPKRINKKYAIEECERIKVCLTKYLKFSKSKNFAEKAINILEGGQKR